MGLINYLGESKVIKRICELLKVTDVKVDGTSVVDDNGVANIPSGGTDVDWNQILANGTKIAEITIDEDEPIEVYAPTPTDVVANPTGTATANLTKLKVGNQILNVPDTKQFADLTDVAIDTETLADGQVPKWNSTTHKWENGEGGSGSGGHTVLDDSDTSLAQEDDLQFKGVYSHDDSTNGKTVVEIARKMTRYQFEQLSAAEKKGLIQIEDEVENDLMIVNGCFIDANRLVSSGTLSNSGTISYTATEDCYFIGYSSSGSLSYLVDNVTMIFVPTNQTHSLLLKKGQTLTIGEASTYSVSYKVYGIQQGTDWHSPDYSTTEHKTGRKWIDGKDVYERVISVDNVGTVDSTSRQVVTLSGVIDTLIGQRISVYDATDKRQYYLPHIAKWSADSIYAQCYLNENESPCVYYISLWSGGNTYSNISNMTAILEYTKV